MHAPPSASRKGRPTAKTEEKCFLSIQRMVCLHLCQACGKAGVKPTAVTFRRLLTFVQLEPKVRRTLHGCDAPPSASKGRQRRIVFLSSCVRLSTFLSSCVRLSTYPPHACGKAGFTPRHVLHRRSSCPHITARSRRGLAGGAARDFEYPLRQTR